MDANQTRFHMLLGEANWRPVLERAAALGEEGAAWDGAWAAVTLARRLFRFERSPSEVPPSLERRRGAAVDRYGNWYWISASGGEICARLVGSNKPQLFWPAPGAGGPKASRGGFAPAEPASPGPAPHLRGLAVTEEHYLVAGTLEPPGLVIFDLHGGGPPLWIAWPEEAPFSPYDMAKGPGGRLYILDREHLRYWVLDRRFEPVPLDQESVEIEPARPFHFRPVGGPARKPVPARTFPIGIALSFASIAAEKPIAIEALPDGSALILDAPAGRNARVLRCAGSRLVGAVELAGVFAGEAFEAFDFALLPDKPGGTPADRRKELSGTLYVAGNDGNQSFAFALKARRYEAPRGGPESPVTEHAPEPGPGLEAGPEPGLELELEMRYLPMRSFGGRGLVPVPCACGGAVYYDREERGVVAWVELVEKPRPRFAPAVVLPEVGMPVEAPGFSGLAFDGKVPGCVWHRVMLDAVIPPGCRVAVESRAADDPSLLAAAPWQPEPDPYLRPMGSEIPFCRPFPGRDGEGARGAGTWELLLQKARGRYLQLRLALFGTGRSTPRLRSLRVYYPRFSYLEKYLPAAYREDPESASFLERFLANPEGIFTALEDRIANAQALFDPRTVPPEYLEWLAGWLGLALDAAWDDNRKRLLLRHAPRMFAERGTVAGIVRAIRLATDPCPDDSIFAEDAAAACGFAAAGRGARGVRIVEQFRTRRGPGVVFGDPTEAEGPGVSSPYSPWSPAQGPDALHERYRRFLLDRYGDVDRLNRELGTSYGGVEAIEFPPVMPEAPALKEAWRAFVRTGIGFPYAPVEAADRAAYQRFLEQRYRRISAFARAAPEYAAIGAGVFSDVPLPARLFSSRRALSDWAEFVSLYLPALERAHRFTVLVPVPGEGGDVICGGCGAPGCAAMGGAAAAGGAGAGIDPEVVRRVVELEKPAHTAFDVKPYWAMFRVGEARLGIDTQPGRSSRLAAAVVGRGSLGEQYLAYAHPWNVRERAVAGRDRVGTGRLGLGLSGCGCGGGKPAGSG